MRDSDSELEEDILMDSGDQKDARTKKKTHLKEDKYIHENADSIVDLADIKAISSITCK